MDPGNVMVGSVTGTVIVHVNQVSDARVGLWITTAATLCK